MSDIARHKRNVKKMLDAGAPEKDIEAYLSGEGVTAAQLRADKQPWNQASKSGPWDKDPIVEVGEQATAQANPWEADAIVREGELEKPKKAKLNDRIAGSIREAVEYGPTFDENPLEASIGAVGKGAAALIDDPVAALKTAGKAVIVDPAKSIIHLPSRLGNSYRSGVTAGIEKIKGNDHAAQEYAAAALGNANEAAIGGINALTIGRGGAIANGARSQTVARAPSPPTLMDDFARSKVDPSVAALTENGLVREATQRIGENAFAGGAVRRNSAKQLGQAQARQEAIASKLGPTAGPTEAGGVAIQGVRNHLADARKVYDKPDSLINYSLSAPRSNQTLTKIQGELRKFDNNQLQEMFEPAALTRVKSILSSGGDISVRDLRQLRTEVRLAKAKPKITATQDDVALGRLEKSLTDDLYKAVAATSGKDAAQSLRVADRAYARTLGRVGGPLSKFAGPNATDEQAFAAIRQAMTGQTASRGVGNANQIKELRRALSPSDLKEVQAGLFRGMGRATEGAEFSAEHFVMQWQKFGNTQKNLMFGTGEIRKDMDALVRVMKAQSRSHVANHSKSGVSVQNVASLAGLANPATMTQTATLLGGANMTGRLLTNPRYVKAVRSVVEAEYQAGLKNTAKSASDLLRAKKKALVTVAAIEKADDSLKDELAQFRVYLTLEGAQ